MIGDWVDLLGDGKGTNVSGTKFLAGQAHPDVGWTARPPDPVDMWGFPLYEGLLSPWFCALPVAADGVLRPRPSRYLGTGNRQKVHQTVPPTRGTGEAGNRGRIGRE